MYGGRASISGGKTYVRLWHPAFLFSAADYPCVGGTGDGDHWYCCFPCAETPGAPSPLGSTLSVGLHPGVSHRYHSLFPALGDFRLPLLHCSGRVWVSARWLRGPTISSETVDDALSAKVLGDYPYRRDDWVVYCPADGLLRR